MLKFKTTRFHYFLFRVTIKLICELLFTIFWHAWYIGYIVLAATLHGPVLLVMFSELPRPPTLSSGFSS